MRRRLDEFTELPQYELDAESMRLLPLPFCLASDVVVLGVVDPGADDPVDVGMLRPDDPGLVRAIEMQLARKVRPVALNQYEIARALDVAGGGKALDRGEVALTLNLKMPRVGG